VNPERWARVKSVVADALELPESERSRFAEQVCADDAEVWREVHALLSAATDEDSLPGARDAIARAALGAAQEHDAVRRADLQRAVGAQYEILDLLGRGGMGAVYLARERALDRLVALKVLRSEVAAGLADDERLTREARVVGQLMHPGIIPLHAFVQAAGLRYFVMGYARGASLAERVAKGRVPWVEAHRMLMELSDALAYAHKHGVIHRDIKPSNILLDDESGRTMLADWGIAQVVEPAVHLAGPGAIVGTPGFMSPEQLHGHHVDERSDIYSLGAVAYTMLAGKDPFRGGTFRELVTQQLQSDPTPLKAIVPNVPDVLAAVVMKCLARERDARWRDARELKDALLRAAERASHGLPEPVRDLPSFGAYALLWALAWSAFAMTSIREPSERGFLLLIAFLVPLGLALHVWNVGRHDLRPAELARVAAWPPEWWGMWWPSSLRRPTDLWPRLPSLARAVRIALSAVFMLVPGLIVLRQWLEAAGVGRGGVDWSWFVVAEAAVIAAAGVVVCVGLAWTRREGLTLGESVRLLVGATTPSSSWQSASLDRLLRPPADDAAGITDASTASGARDSSKR
jgi:serine/threonine protein kinase